MEFAKPDFLLNQGERAIHERMLARLPDRFDKSEGGLLWDITYPLAYEKAQAIEFTLTEAIKNLFPLWAYGDLLDAHGLTRNLARKGAVAATGTVTFQGANGVTIPAGTRLWTTPAGEEESCAFETTEAATIAGGVASAGVRCAEAGAAGNVAAGRVDKMDSWLMGITAVTNAQAIGGGADAESDEDYRERLLAYDRTQGEAYTGSVADYQRWAMAVPGVGAAKVIPAADDSGTVTITLTASDGTAAGAALRTQVYNAIMSPNDPTRRLAPINALLSVVAPTVKTVAVAASVTLDGSVSAAQVQAIYRTALLRYVEQANAEGAFRLSRAAEALMGVDGVKDYASLTLNGAAANVALDSDEICTLGQVVVSA